MNGLLLPVGDGHTELTEDDRVGLIPSYLTTRGDLFAAEQRNIAFALLRRSPSLEALLDDSYLRSLHRNMFGHVWEWAGRYRRRETNIGIDPAQIATSVRVLVDDVAAWVDNETYEPDEIAVRFHHGLVAIHPFPNGNGRHSRIAADYLADALGRPRFSWGSDLGVSTEELRATYRLALQQADAGDIDELLVFARS